MLRRQILYINFVIVGLGASRGFSSEAQVEKPLINPPKTIYAFGDSYTDGGEDGVLSSFIVSRDLMLTPRHAPEQAQWQPAEPDSYYIKAGRGRWSNGLTAVEVLASKLGAKLNNYAVGGAKSGQDNYSPWLDTRVSTGVLSQIEVYKTANKGGADPDALYYVFVSANDYFQAQDQHLESNHKSLDKDGIALVADNTVKNIKQTIESLATLGARRFFLVGSSDLSVVPWEVYYHRQQEAAAYTAAINQALTTQIPVLMEELGVEIILFDHKAVSDRIRSAPARYGFSDLNSPCLLTQYPSPAKAAETSPCDRPADHYFWDEWHPSAALHKLIGEAMYQQLQSAGTSTL